jgi:hypothetical protein
MKPNNFPLITPVANTELYTQTNDIVGKFTMNSAKEFITAPTDVTYSELYNKIINEELVAGSWYRLTDYRSVNFLNGWGIANNNPTPVVPSFNPREVVMGDETEVLLLQAISSYEISPIGYSETFAQDIVTYLPLVNKIGVNISIQNGLVLSDGILNTIVSGFDLQWDGTNVYFNMPSGYPAYYGHYFYLYCSFNDGIDNYYQEGTYEPLSPNGICQYPSVGNYNQEKTMSRIKLENGGAKVVLLDLVEQDYLNYDASSLYVEHIQALNDAYGWVTRRQDTQNRIDVPFDFRWIKYRRYECEVLGNITSISYTATGTTAADNTYNNLSPNSDTSTDGQNATFSVTVSGGIVTDVVINNSGRLYANGDTLTIDGSQIGGVTIDDDVVITVNGLNSNIGYWGIGDVFNGANTTGNFKDSLSIDWTKWNIYNLEIDGQGGADANNYNGNCENNVFLGGVYDCKIGNYFQSNTIGGNFYYNTIETQFQGNTIFGNFGYNTIGDAFIFNTIGNNSINNTIGDSFQFNTIGANFNINTIGGSFASNSIGDRFQSNTIGDGFNQNTIGVDFQTNTIGISFGGNAIGNNFSNNTIGISSGNNTIGINFTNNSIGISFQSNTIGDNFYSNIIGDTFNANTIGNGFYSNTIGNNFNGSNIGINFNGNNIGDTFESNNIGNGFRNSSIGHAFYNNTIGIDFQYNNIGNNFEVNTIGNDFRWNTTKYLVVSTDFSLATHVYADYNCEIFRRSNSTLRLSYIDGSDVIQYTAITA